MSLARLFRYFLARCLPALLLGLAGASVGAQNDPPGRVGRLNHTEGAVTFSPAGDNEWTDAVHNRPLTRGDRLWTDKGSRAEIQVGSSAVRMGGQTQLEVLTLDDQSAQLSLTQGTVYVRVRSLPEGENFEIDTPNLAYRAAYPGDYRVDVDAERGTTRVTIHSGTGAVYGETGQALPMGGGQQITFRARTLAQVDKQESPPQDNFDRWAAERNRREDQSVSARYVPREVVGYQQLDAHGQWSQDPTHGAVWFPQSVAANWAPYRDGRWEWIAPWGWTWIDDAAWAFAPSHYGRWALINSRWGWVPGRLGLRPIYSPALVAFIGGGSTSAWSIPIAAGRSGMAWFPLAPGEPWQPGFKASQTYISSVNRNMSPVATASYAHQGRPESLTAIPADDFNRGKPVRGSWLRVAANALTQAQIVPPPPMPEGSALVSRDRPGTTRAGPPRQNDIRQIAANPSPQQQQQQVQVQAKLEQAKLEQAKLEQAKLEQAKLEQAKLEQAKLEKARLAEQTRVTEQAKAGEQLKLAQAKAEEAKRAEQAKLAQQAKAAERARAAEDARLTQQAAAEQARAVQQAKAAEQAKLLAQQNKAAEQARALAQQSKSEQARLAQQDKAADQARLAQQLKAERLAQEGRAAEQTRLAQQTKASERTKRIELAKAEESLKRDRQMKRAQPARQEQLARRGDTAVKRETVAKRSEPSAREDQARRAAPGKRPTYATRQDKARQDSQHAERVEQSRRAADREAEVLRAQRERARREGQEYEQAQRESWERHQQALSEQWRREQQQQQQALEQQRERARQRPILRTDRPAPPAEVWQRGIPILNPGRTS